MKQGTLFGKYIIHNQLGRGGMGVVYLAEDRSLERYVALKVLDQNITASPFFEQRFLQEARTIASLNHPNILPIYALSRIDDYWVIEMPHIEGGSLADAEMKGNLDVRHTLRYIRDVLLALAVCHESNVIHRDVKPSNILLGKDGRGILSDFGLAKILSAHQQDSLKTTCSSTLFIGTPRYAPPESWEEQTPSAAWDIYSVGMVLYEVVTGSTPYDAQTPLSLMKQILERPIPPLKELVPAVSAELNDLVAEMLRHDPVERIHDVADVLERFWGLPELSEESASAPVLLKPYNSQHVTINKSHEFAQRGTDKRKIKKGLIIAILSIMTAIGIGVFALFETYDSAGFRLSANAFSLSPEKGRSQTLVSFDTVYIDSQQILSGYCMAEMSDHKQPSRILAAGPQYLWLLDLAKQSNDTFAIQGYWADYGQASAPLFRHGNVSGKGQWVHEGEDLAATLIFENGENASTWNQSILFRRSDIPETGPSYLCKLSSTDAIPSLLFNEMIPRNLEWMDTLESFLRSLGLVQVSVYKNSAEVDTLALDGRLSENIWQAPLTHKSLMPPSSGPPSSFMQVYRSNDAVYIGLHIPLELTKPRLLLALQINHAIPAGSAKRFTVQIDNGIIKNASILELDTSLPWECNWEVAQTTYDGITQVEIKIPFYEMGILDTSLTGQRWLLNCQAGTARPDGINVIAQWGNDDVVNTPCGMVLAFPR